MKARFLLLAALFTAASLSAQEAKNVQILKGMTPTQLQRTMNFMRASLGVHCDYCHVVSEEKGWDFASDAKPEKEAGRRMIRLVMDMNAKYFEGHNAVTCNTCHRGAIRPVGMVSLPQAQPPFPTPEPQRPTLPTRDEVIAKYAAAVGKIDEKALASVTLTGTREAPDGKTAPFTINITPGNLRIDSADRVTVIAQGTAWTKDEKGVRETPRQVEHLSQLNDAFRFIVPKDIAANARVIRKDKIGDRDVFVVQTPATETSPRQRFSFDAQTGLLLRRVSYTATPIADIPLQTDYSDYREINGMKLPYTIRVDSVDPWIGATRRFAEIRLGTSPDASMFVMPK